MGQVDQRASTHPWGPFWVTAVHRDTDDMGKLLASAHRIMPVVEVIICVWLPEAMLMPKLPRFLFPSEMCLKRRRAGGGDRKRKEKRRSNILNYLVLLSLWSFFFWFFFFPMVLPCEKWEESEKRQEGGILYSNDSKENFHSCDAGMWDFECPFSGLHGDKESTSLLQGYSELRWSIRRKGPWDEMHSWLHRAGKTRYGCFLKKPLKPLQDKVSIL